MEPEWGHGQDTGSSALQDKSVTLSPNSQLPGLP